MSDQILELVRQAVASPWFYLAVFLVAAVDAFFPLVPSETAVITGGVFAASGQTNLAAVVLAAAAGAVAGDHISYAVGSRSVSRLATHRRGPAALAWAHRVLDRRGGLTLVTARYIPGGRTAVTLTMGGIGYPRARFALFDSLAGLSWGLFGGLVGLLGGAAFEQRPLPGVLLGIGIALTITAVVELWRHVRSRRGSTPTAPPPPQRELSTSGRPR